MAPEKRFQRARAYLKNAGIISPLEKTAYLATAGEINGCCDINNIKQTLQKRCWINQSPHMCLEAFKDNPQVVRNWRLLWHSLPRSTRAELLIKLFNQVGNTGMMTFLGVRVCQKAFTMLAGIGASALSSAKGRASTGRVSVWTSRESLQGMMIKPTSKDPKYLDAREWLEVYADRHAEQSPMTGAFCLPSGRKTLYWAQYVYEREQEPGGSTAPASCSTFMKAWKRECPHIVVTKSVAMFTRCGLCDFLQTELARCPRSDAAVADMLRRRLGQHYEFQAAQRLAQGRIEEQCRRSGGAEWQARLVGCPEQCQ